MTDERHSRRLSAIMAADVVGYSRLMATDEAGTLKELNRHMEGLFNPAIARNEGRIVKLMGDGALVEFMSAVDAVRCAQEIQETIAGAGAPDGIVLRIGINLGDIIIQGDDIFGDGVNIASRIEQLAKPGGLCVSSVVHEIVDGRLPVAFTDGGPVSVKNIDRPLRVFHWHPGDPATPAPAAAPRPAPAAAPRPAPADAACSIAVLPLDNMSGDPEQEYFSDGISEDIITDLSKVSGLTVIARNSSFAYKGKSTDLRVVGRELGVTHVLEGSVRRAGQRVRINAQLIDALTGGHVWADRYDRDLTDIFAVQDEVTFEIVKALKISLSPAERANIVDVGTTDVAAHEDYMRMRGFLFFPGMTAEGWKQAVLYGERSIERDPNYSAPYGMLAMMHLLDYHNHWSGRPSEEAMQAAHDYAHRGLEIGPDDLWPNHAVAVVARWQGHLDLAIEKLDKAMAQSADYSLGWFTRGEIELARGELNEAIEHLERAIRLDPSFRHQYMQFLAMAHFLKGNFETAVVLLKERVFLVKDTDIGRAWLASALGHVGDREGAQEVWAELMTINPTFSITTRMKRLTLADPAHEALVLEGLTKAGLPVDG
ncbi:adenylate/guanylate cyclase domain-containing protein [Ovoidimarina sediminis]|uniref:adenylate/guanylate cyclase domain-containing protein n=1 Tax=Ovoidimarina sediminis TaxID=3079856 RepID=UPI002910D2B0|nr:adenylate/guanylate cyclase domain-containing protein [Rhodophyticola sp. MJ-SS7]MDU8943391.1 adenylate/guanylate cyclase domain-containing protein [Rhodophyticola sp. MJ-SS7]